MVGELKDDQFPLDTSPEARRKGYEAFTKLFEGTDIIVINPDDPDGTEKENA